MEELIKLALLLLGVCLMILSFLLLRIGIDILRAPQHLWQRNQRATRIVQRFNTGTMTEREHAAFDELRREGIIEIHSISVSKDNRFVMKARLTHEAIRDIIPSI